MVMVTHWIEVLYTAWRAGRLHGSPGHVMSDGPRMILGM